MFDRMESHLPDSYRGGHTPASSNQTHGTFRDDYMTQGKPMSTSAGMAGCQVGLRCFLSHGANRGKWNLTGRVALLLPVSREKHAVTKGSQANKRNSGDHGAKAQRHLESAPPVPEAGSLPVLKLFLNKSLVF